MLYWYIELEQKVIKIYCIHNLFIILTEVFDYSYQLIYNYYARHHRRMLTNG